MAHERKAPLGMLLGIMWLLSMHAADAAPIEADEAVVATGMADYALIKDGVPPSCAGSGPFTATFDSRTGRFGIVGSATGCVPVVAVVTGCVVEPDQTVRCEKDVGAERIRIALAPDGALDYLWTSPDFSESILGTMQRAP